MYRQDRQGVRTAQDLERKYRLSEIQRAFEQTENSLPKINQILQDFVNSVIGTIDSFEGLTDGHITAYFGSGVPSLETEPTISWEEPFENHVNDLYYDKDEGRAYNFTEVEEDSYEWVLVQDSNKIKVLAMANATEDASDGFRRIFVEQPIPPYDNGDLWVKDGVIYSCQISKPSTESYESQDFIESSKYSGDTLAIKIGTELEVLKGTVLKIIEDTDYMRVEINDLDQETTSSIDLIKNALATLITDENGQSMMKQTSNGWVFEMKSILETISSNSEKANELENEANQTKSDLEKIDELVRVLEEKTTYIRMGEFHGEACIELGSEDSDFKLVITQTRIMFMEGSVAPAYITNKTLVITKAYVKDLLQIGTMALVKRANGHISFMEVSDDELAPPLLEGIDNVST